MKITFIEIEADAEDLKASRTLGESLSIAFGRIFERMGEKPITDCEDESLEAEE